MSNAGTVLIIGATQGTGALIAHQLIDQERDVTVIARNRAKAEAVFAGKPVQIIQADLARPDTLPGDLQRFSAIILTAGVTKRPASEALVRSTEYEGTRHLLEAAKAAGFGGRLLYMNSIGTTKSSWLGVMLNLIKGKTLVWRKEAEQLICGSGITYTIIRAGMLNDQPAGGHDLLITSEDLPLTLRYQISRADVANLFVRFLDDQESCNKTISAIWKLAE